MDFNRIYILGTSGAGKTTAANLLSKKLKIPSYDLDDLFWKRKYDVKRNEKERQQLLIKICNKRRWIIEGVYDKWVEEAIKKSDLVLLLDIHPFLLTCRLLKRFFKRRKKEDRGSWRDNIALILYVWRYKHENQAAGYLLHKQLIERNKRKHVHIKTTQQLKNFLNDIH